ncbi:AraC family transcriptional regulator [uncultured Lacinutrix sp.]|uniref:helix-turn-helix domain-containing protein n=1 Tax=uncultured Lacinutrix sp. TaxID=574032 RepID=UPI00261904D2|nr:helix-turn-helix domain-containing protein [uncultured Lacinutrix sp.]
MPLSLVDIILVIGMSQGLFLALAIQLLPNKNKKANRTLSIILLIASLTLFVRAVPFIITGNIKLGIIADTTIYIFGPLLYSYIRQLTFNEKPAFRLNWYHYTPIFLNIIYFIWSLFYSVTELNELIKLGKLNIMFFIVELGGLLSIAFYWIQSFLILKKFKQIQKNQLSFNQNIIRYLTFVLSALAFFLILWLLTFVCLYSFGYYSNYINYTTMWLSAPVFIYFIGFFSLTQPNIFRLPLENKLAAKKTIVRLKPEEIELLKNRLNELITEDNIHTTPHLSLKSLSEALNTSSNNLSWLLNQVYKKTFYEYINHFRIEDFLQKIQENQHQSKTLLAIAMDSGFNSKSTFNKAFKAIMNDTPSNYIKQNL